MSIFNKIIQLSVIVLNGAFIGAMLIIGLVLLPFWKSVESQVFLAWFSAYSGTIGSIMIPFGPSVLILAVIALVFNKNNRLLWGLTVVLTMVNTLYFPIYYMPTNNSFAMQTIALNEVGTELSNWQNYHWQRLFFAIGALITSVLAVSKTIKKKE